MRTVPRARHYISPGALALARPVLSFDYAREAYVLRGIGDRIGPVLRENRRRSSEPGAYTGPERRGGGHALRTGVTAARPQGLVQRQADAPSARGSSAATDASRRARSTKTAANRGSQSNRARGSKRPRG